MGPYVLMNLFQISFVIQPWFLCSTISSSKLLIADVDKNSPGKGLEYEFCQYYMAKQLKRIYRTTAVHNILINHQ